MLFPQFLLVSLAVSATASKLPLIQPEDGVYAVTIGEKGQEIHTRISNITQAEVNELMQNSTPDIADLRKPAEGQMETRAWRLDDTCCGCGYNLPHGDIDAAVEDLKYQIDENGSVLWTNFYSIRGGSVAFGCVNGLRQFGSLEVEKAYALITKRCGWYVAGSYQKTCIDTPTKPFDLDCPEWTSPTIGYMNWYPDQDFCKNAKGSSQRSC
ncbi:hypothetical protein PGQ11_000513 [Apiospora arundinis]